MAVKLNNNNNSHDNVYGAVIMAKVIARVHTAHLMNVDWASGGRQPHTKPVDLGCKSAENWQLSSTSTIAIVIIIQPVGWYSFYRPTKGGRLSRPKHCSKGAQLVLKPTVYRSSCRDKHNCQRRDSNLDPLTPVRRANHLATETCMSRDVTRARARYHVRATCVEITHLSTYSALA